ncbi:hypothetical protein L486_00518 [Kwoniella mangroviensis CBS 10435]|uniref:Phosphoglycerate mutase n=1 Tax=Kwoniella mangroviensis CBS 10435 TaxID=1331196 RepID=A0A1B9IZN5_9TREE|nr:uncharacterized protein I203_04052 [Kwoniella mangroviensis CBS 8507]OCF60874.1 hypothetical protein L486_00518 [Kwoniella mangroviensis CBS 10435]OCF66476.1 hypothetical protein I203_04052 [Kwoniella mangroviensis CBS 8507]OCF74376.1 hypothetical protein I204_04747 [Kwoniella mangroviensis CBS 8886]
MSRKSKATSKRLHLTRHAQAEHNVASDYTIADAPLTSLGKKQSRELNELTKDTFQKTAELLVSSPLRRPMETMLIGYPSLKERLDKEGKPVILLDTLQEVGPYACDTPTYPISKLKSSNDGIFSELDFSTLSEDYASKQGIYAPENGSERAKRVRHWLRDREESEIVVVAHGDILRYLADNQQSSRPWDNAEVKVFTFVSEDDENASLVEVDIHAEPRDATDEPTSREMRN